MQNKWDFKVKSGILVHNYNTGMSFLELQVLVRSRVRGMLLIIKDMRARSTQGFNSGAI